MGSLSPSSIPPIFPSVRLDAAGAEERRDAALPGRGASAIKPVIRNRNSSRGKAPDATIIPGLVMQGDKPGPARLGWMGGQYQVRRPFASDDAGSEQGMPLHAPSDPTLPARPSPYRARRQVETGIDGRAWADYSGGETGCAVTVLDRPAPGGPHKAIGIGPRDRHSPSGGLPIPARTAARWAGKPGTGGVRGPVSPARIPPPSLNRPGSARNRRRRGWRGAGPGAGAGGCRAGPDPRH